jgi:hypothetical protein
MAKGANNNYQRLSDRYDYPTLACVMYSSDLSINVKVIEVSKTGIKIKSQSNVPHGIIDLKFQTKEGQWIEIQCERVWDKDNFIGLRIYGGGTADWNNFITDLSKKLTPLPFVA